MTSKNDLNIHGAFKWRDNFKKKYFETYKNLIPGTIRETSYEAGEIIYYNDIAEDTSENIRHDEILKEADVEYGGLVEDNLPADFICRNPGLEV